MIASFLILCWLILPVISAKILLNKVIIISKKKNWVKKNYRGDLLPNTLGITFAINSFIFYLFVAIILFFYCKYAKLDAQYFTIFSFLPFIFSVLILLIGISGFYDDIFGRTEIKGFKGHLRKLFREKEITSGLIKIITGVFASLIIGYLIENFIAEIHSSDFRYSNKIFYGFVIIDTLIISLLMNFTNLLDLRPGRAIKVFFVVLILMSVYKHDYFMGIFFLPWIYFCFSPFFSSLLIYLPTDFKGKGMMGDAGSNLLGFILGFIMILEFSSILYIDVYLKVGSLLFLIFINIYCEFYSLSDLIEKNRVLRFLDRFGTSA